MGTTLTVSDKVARHLDSLVSGQQGDSDRALRHLLVTEYRRRLTHYHLTDRQLAQKYGQAFEGFELEQTTQKAGYSWEVESDAIAWETAVDGIRTMQRLLSELDGLDDEA